MTGAWWDHVDVVAARRVGPIRRGHPTEVTPVVLEWARSPDRWLRRTAVRCQLGAKDATDRDLLAAVLEPNLEDPDFFLRKAIGWALRDLARTDAGWVRRYVADREDRLSPLSRREALKNVGR